MATTADIQKKSPLITATLLDQPELIRVMVLNKKIAEQLPYLDGEGMYAQEKFDVAKIDDVEFIGALGGIPVVRTPKDNKIWKVRPMPVMDWVMNHKGGTVEQAQKLLNGLPQLFEV